MHSLPSDGSLISEVQWRSCWSCLWLPVYMAWNAVRLHIVRRIGINVLGHLCELIVSC